MVDHLQSRVTPWCQYASHVKVRGTSSKIVVSWFLKLSPLRTRRFHWKHLIPRFSLGGWLVGGGGGNNRLLFIKIGYCFLYCFLENFIGGQNQQGGHKPEKTWKTQGIWKTVRISGKTRENFNFWRKPWKTQGKCKGICGIIANKNVSEQIFSLELLREKIENTLENSLREFSLSKMWPLWIEMGSLPVPPTKENPAPLGFFLVLCQNSLMQEHETFRLLVFGIMQTVLIDRQPGTSLYQLTPSLSKVRQLSWPKFMFPIIFFSLKCVN